MMRTLTTDEELDLRQKAFEQLTPGCLFDLGQKRYFILVRKSGPQGGTPLEIPEKNLKHVLVVELTPVNREKIIEGALADSTVLSFEEMSCLNLRD